MGKRWGDTKERHYLRHGGEIGNTFVNEWRHGEEVERYISTDMGEM